MDSFQEKAKYSRQLIKRALSNSKNPLVACSFGKDSIVVLHLVRQYAPNVKVLWNNTLVEYPDTYKFAKKIIDEWKLDCIVAKPNVSFWDIVEKYGFPINSRNSKGKKQCATYQCCYELKKKPTVEALKTLKSDLYFTGLTRYESRLREFSARKYGDYFYSKKWKHVKCHPIQNWRSEDVWQYIKENNVPYNPLYDKDEVEIEGGIRTGCWPCTQAIKYGKLHHLREYYPKLFELLVVKKKLGEVMIGLRIEKYKNVASRRMDFQRNLTYKAMDLEGALAIRPCFFDRL